MTKKPTLNPVLRSFWRTKARNKVLYGGRASSKSWDAAGVAVYLSNKYTLRFLCVRQLQNKIEQSVYSLLKIQIARFGLQQNFKILDNKIINLRTGSEFMFYGLWRNIEEIKSIESVDILWSEESHALLESQWEILEPTIRKEGSECWIIFNPDLVTDFVWRNFVINPPKNTLVRKINYTENGFLSRTALDVIEDKKVRDPEAFPHVYLGEPREDSEESVIKASWVSACIDAHLKIDGFDESGRYTVGFDIADDGNDKCATVTKRGGIALQSDEWKALEDELLKSCTRAHNTAKKVDAEIIYDCIGVGASAGAKFKELKSVKYYKFNAGDKVFKPHRIYAPPKITHGDLFSNAKAQAWWCMADRFKITFQVINAIANGTEIPKHNKDDLISISSKMPNLEKLKMELSAPRRDFDKHGKVKVESKDDMKKRGIPSPNVADAFIMAFVDVKRSLNITTDLSTFS